MVVRLYNIVSPNSFTISIKEGETCYPLTGYTFYRSYPANTQQIEIDGFTFAFNTEYWVKITDDVTNRDVIKNVKINDPLKYIDCGASCRITGLATLNQNTDVVTLKLTFAGNNTGPFNVYRSDDGGSTFQIITELELIEKSELLYGYNLYDESSPYTTSTIIRVESTNECRNYKDIGVISHTIAPDE